MRYRQVCLESLGFTLPGEAVTSDSLEARLQPLYQRLKLPAGRLELMTGIRERRFWKPGTLPSENSIASGRRALEAADFDPARVGMLVHGSVCRDHLEPATASIVHHGLGLRPECLIYDVSNACLGFLNGLVQVANSIELGQLEAGLVVASEGSREVVENTIAQLNRDSSLSRQAIKSAVASLTLGSASVAGLLVRADLSRGGSRLHTAVARAATEHNELCRSGRDEAAAQGMQTLMHTDSERLLQAGVEAARDTFSGFLSATQWQRGDIQRVFCHQVGVAHRRALFAALELDEALDFSTVEWLGNTGAAALPVTLALAAYQRKIAPGNRLALLGIGSGINVLMLGVDWHDGRVGVPQGCPLGPLHSE